jgi:hypothetical protein
MKAMNPVSERLPEISDRVGLRKGEDNDLSR